MTNCSWLCRARSSARGGADSCETAIVNSLQCLISGDLRRHGKRAGGDFSVNGVLQHRSVFSLWPENPKLHHGRPRAAAHGASFRRTTPPFHPRYKRVLSALPVNRTVPATFDPVAVSHSWSKLEKRADAGWAPRRGLTARVVPPPHPQPAGTTRRS